MPPIHPIYALGGQGPKDLGGLLRFASLFVCPLVAGPLTSFVATYLICLFALAGIMLMGGGYF